MSEFNVGDKVIVVSTTIHQNWRCGHEPMLAHIVIDSLCMVGVITVSCGNTRK